MSDLADIDRFALGENALGENALGENALSGNAAAADIIVVAAGSSRRMGGIDKLAWSIAGRPLLAYALAAVAAPAEVESIVVVTSPERRGSIAEASWLPAKVRAVVAGGTRRQDSVRAGFAALESVSPDPSGGRVVLIHDGARPIVSERLIRHLIVSAAEYGAAIPVVPIVETVKRVDDGRVGETVDRTELALAQTPQAVRRDRFRTALAAAGSLPVGAEWTDEAALLEACRIPVHVVPGEPSNLKVTIPADLDRAAAALSPTVRARRHGIGQDTHPFGPGTPLRLGGVEFPGVPRLSGHSDGDVVLHAVADAMLGAASLGDLGTLFPAGPNTPVGIASTDLLAGVIGRLAEAGWRASAVDLTIVAARPRLGARLDEIRSSLARLLAIDPDAVGVKASTGNLDGSEGAGRAVSALALVVIEADR